MIQDGRWLGWLIQHLKSKESFWRVTQHIHSIIAAKQVSITFLSRIFLRRDWR